MGTRPAMRDGYPVLDADSHVMEPGGLFGGAVVPGRPVMDLPATTPMLLGGRLDRITDQLQHGFDAASYLRAMDAEGVDATVLYPSMGLWVPFQPELSAAESGRACDAYNEWVAEYCSADPHRLAAAALLPLADPALAASTVHRAAALGLVAVLMRPNRLYGRNPGDAAYDVLYDAIEETGLVLSLHEGLGVRGPTMGSERFAGYVLRHACSHPMEQMSALASLIVDGALDRHPALRVAVLESGTGWLPFWLDRLEEHLELAAESEPHGLQLTPAEYFSRQAVICADVADPFVRHVVDHLGAQRVVVATDFPHPESVYPEAVSAFFASAARQGLAAEAIRALLWDTPAAFYRLTGRFGPQPVHPAQERGAVDASVSDA